MIVNTEFYGFVSDVCLLNLKQKYLKHGVNARVCVRLGAGVICVEAHCDLHKCHCSVTKMFGFSPGIVNGG